MSVTNRAPLKKRLRSAKKATLMTQVRFAEGIELRTEARFEVRGIKLTILEI